MEGGLREAAGLWSAQDPWRCCRGAGLPGFRAHATCTSVPRWRGWWPLTPATWGLMSAFAGGSQGLGTDWELWAHHVSWDQMLEGGPRSRAAPVPMHSSQVSLGQRWRKGASPLDFEGTSPLLCPPRLSCHGGRRAERGWLGDGMG